ncbi:AAA family ATPase [Candidatus Vampirococcus lugosii]|uniref:Shikimate kinase n=1 Tax=Candidatus Vampirococcus lugosii TaxID=2789015 RepID=A0ABS5QMS3_9BACT|nr:AAA family ATPase [Candidatus Vampirococcus lugosii]MBS8122467.1 hypothetical protein [Candidatus Vampirococcus lugosii]
MNIYINTKNLIKKNKINKSILITGISYSGKTYLYQNLKNNKDINLYDADEIGVGKWYNKKNQIVKFKNNANEKRFKNHNFLWDIKFLKLFLNKNNNCYLFGLSENIFEASKLFDKCFFLNINSNELKKRFNKNDRNNPMGNTIQQQNIILNYMNNFKNQCLQNNFISIDATKSPIDIKNYINTLI